MNKRRLHHYWTKFRVVRPMYFLVAAVIALCIGIYSMRQNNLHMIVLRNKVTEADKDSGNVEVALRNLREYVYSHMNTNLASDNTAIKPPIQLKYTYDRLVKAEQDGVAAANATVYTDAQTTCQQQFPDSFSGGPRVPCIQAYVTSHGAKEKQIPDALYKYDFQSPFWSPDLAGWSLVVTGLFFFLFVLSYGLDRWVRYELRKQL
jgi:hypothetical protein